MSWSCATSAVATGPSSIASVGLEESSTLAHLGSTAVVAAGLRKRIVGPSTEGEDSIQAPKSLLRTVTWMHRYLDHWGPGCSWDCSLLHSEPEQGHLKS